MFIRKELMKKVKEVIFKKGLQEKLNPFLGIEPKDLDRKMVNKNMDIMSNLEHIEGYVLSDGENNLYYLMRDLLNTNSKYSKNYSYLSDLGRSLSKQQLVSNKKVQRSLENSTKITVEIANLLSSQSSEAVLVGGCVRDAILDKKPKDFDFATNAHYDDVEFLLKENGFSIKEAGKQFLVMIVSKEGEDFEIAMFRKDGNYTDGRRPDSVEIGTIYDDAERRDFTINSLSYNIERNEVQDPNGTGLKDINDKVLRFVGKADDRIKEDYLRIARFYRFLGRFKEIGMKPDMKSLKACRTNFAAMQSSVAPERLKMELEKMIGL